MPLAPLAHRVLEPYALAWIHLALRRGFGTNWGFGLLRGS